MKGRAVTEEPRFRKVAILGVGLIGGSIGRALLDRKAACKVTGLFRRTSTLEEALEAGAVSEGFMELEPVLTDAEVVIPAAGVRTILEHIDAVKNLVPQGALVTDTGSTKKAVVGKMAAVFGQNRTVFPVGSHPLYGSHRKGPAAGAALSPEKQLTVVSEVPGHSNSQEAADRADEFWRLLGMRTIRLDAEEHDRLLAFSSHLPHTVAQALVSALPEEAERFISTGLLDSTRIAASPANIWTDIFLTNREALLQALGGLKDALGKIEEALSANEGEALLRLLSGIQERRVRWQKEKERDGSISG